MVAKRGGLGRNLSALLNQTNTPLFSENTEGSAPVAQTTLAVNALQPGKYQPRREMAEDSLLELADSIKQHGLLQPVIVRAVSPNQYEIIAGERRWRACKMAGLTDIAVIVRDVDDATAMALALIENLQRNDLNALDQALAMQRLVQECALTHQQIADLLCKSRAAVSNHLRLLQLNHAVKCLVEHGDLDMGHARCLLMLEGESQTQAAQLVVSKGLSVRETEALVTRLKAGAPIDAPKPTVAPLFNDQLKALANQLDTKIKLKPGANGRGTLLIHYDGEGHLEHVIGRLIG